MKEVITGAVAGFIIVSAVYNVIGSGAAGRYYKQYEKLQAQAEKAAERI